MPADLDPTVRTIPIIRTGSNVSNAPQQSVQPHLSKLAPLAEELAAVTLTTPIKVNLALTVLERRRHENYHDLVSLVGFLNGGDVITVTPAAAGSSMVNFESANTFDSDITASLPNPNSTDNTVSRALLWVNQKGFATRWGHTSWRVTVRKEIPICSGLGGGSVDAACVLRTILTPEALHQILTNSAHQADLARTVGADVPVCLHGQLALMSGIGDVVVSLAPEAMNFTVPAGVTSMSGRQYANHGDHSDRDNGYNSYDTQHPFMQAQNPSQPTSLRWSDCSLAVITPTWIHCPSAEFFAMLKRSSVLESSTSASLTSLNSSTPLQSTPLQDPTQHNPWRDSQRVWASSYDERNSFASILTHQYPFVARLIESLTVALSDVPSLIGVSGTGPSVYVIVAGGNSLVREERLRQAIIQVAVPLASPRTLWWRVGLLRTSDLALS